MVFGAKLVKDDVNELAPVPSVVLVVSAIVGLVVVDQTTPLADMDVPPSDVIIPPEVAVVVVIPDILDVVNVGTAFNLFARQNLKQVSRFLNL